MLVPAYMNTLKNWKDFKGRTNRAGFWWFFLANFLVGLIVSAIAAALGIDILATIYSLVLLIPTIAIGARRLHDIGKSGWWQLIMFIPVVGIIALLIMWAMPTKRGK